MIGTTCVYVVPRPPFLCAPMCCFGSLVQLLSLPPIFLSFCLLALSRKSTFASFGRLPTTSTTVLGIAQKLHWCWGLDSAILQMNWRTRQSVSNPCPPTSVPFSRVETMSFGVSPSLKTAFLMTHSVSVSCSVLVGGIGRPWQEIPYEDIPHMPPITVSGHGSRLLFGRVGTKKLYCFSGRHHTYEGIPFWEVCFIVRLSAYLGCKAYVLTNASGGSQQGMYPGCFMLITDHLRFTFRDPLIGTCVYVCVCIYMCVF